MNEPITKRDVLEQNIDKIFPEGPCDSFEREKAA